MKILLEQLDLTQLELQNRVRLKVFNMGQTKRKAEGYKYRKLEGSKLRSKRFRDKKQLILAYSGKSERQLKNIAPEEFLLIKEQIRREASRESKKAITTWSLIAISIITLLLVLL